MRKVTALVFLFSLSLARLSLSGETALPEEKAPAAETACSKGEKACPGEKVTKLLTSWKALAEAEKTGCPEERAKLQTEFSGVAKNCPIGSRMPETLGFVKSVLVVSFGEKEACAKVCPLAQAGQTLDATAVRKEAKVESSGEIAKAMAARTSLGRDLHQLISFAVAAAPSSACCEKAAGEACKKDGEDAKESKVATAVTAVTTQAAAGTAAPAGKAACADGAGGVCCKDLMARAQALKASWDKAGGEFASMCPVKKKELFASMKSLGERSKVVCLLPETVMTLVEGFEALEAMDAKVSEYAKAHPDQVKNVPEEEEKSFAEQSKLIHEAAEVLRRVRTAAAATQGVAASQKQGEPSVSG
jgi:hypothetical protein